MRVSITLLILILPFLSIAQPVNDNPCSAILLTEQTGYDCTPTNIYQWSGATYSTGSSAGCGFNLNSKDVWFKFVASGSDYIVKFSQAYIQPLDLVASVRDAESCGLFYSFEQCNDDDGPLNYPMLQLHNLVNGMQYYIRVWNYDGADSGSAKICLLKETVPNTSNNNTGIGTAYPNATLDVNGNLRIRGGSPGVNKTLTSDSQGNATWQLPKPAQGASVTFLNSETVTVTNTTYQLLRLRNELIDDGNVFDDSVFIAPESGLYQLNVQLRYTATGLNTSLDNRVSFKVEPPPGIYFGYADAGFPAFATTSVVLYYNRLYKLNQGQKLKFSTNRTNGSGTVTLSTGMIYSFINIYKVN